jgi:hypothetical protein
VSWRISAAAAVPGKRRQIANGIQSFLQFMLYAFRE